MPELTAVHVGIIAAMLVVGVILGWLFRGDRCAKEKIAINAGWQDQIESQQSEHSRLAEQNKSLMEQISQYQASHKEATNRAKELSESLKESFVQRDELAVQAKGFRAKLEVAIAQRNRLKSENDSNESQGAATASSLKVGRTGYRRWLRSIRNVNKEFAHLRMSWRAHAKNFTGSRIQSGRITRGSNRLTQTLYQMAWMHPMNHMPAQQNMKWRRYRIRSTTTLLKM